MADVRARPPGGRGKGGTHPDQCVPLVRPGCKNGLNGTSDPSDRIAGTGPSGDRALCREPAIGRVDCPRQEVRQHDQPAARQVQCDRQGPADTLRQPPELPFNTPCSCASARLPRSRGEQGRTTPGHPHGKRGTQRQRRFPARSSAHFHIHVKKCTFPPARTGGRRDARRGLRFPQGPFYVSSALASSVMGPLRIRE